MYKRKKQGFTLVEVLLAWALLSVGLAAVSFVQLRCLQRMHIIYEQQVMHMQLEDFGTVIRHSSIFMRNQYFQSWQQQTKQLLPGSKIKKICRLNRCCVDLSLINLAAKKLCVDV